MADATTVKGHVRSKRTWTPEEDEKLMDALTELHTAGKYAADNGFKPGYYQAVQNLMDVSLPNSGLKAEPHIKSRLKTWKANFSTFHDMVVGSCTSGFGWDPNKCIVTAPDEVWDEYLKSHKNASIFRDKPFPLYHKLCSIFGKDRASGSRAVDLGEEEVVRETNEGNLVDLEDHDTDTGLDSARGGMSGASTKRKRGKESTDDLIQVYMESCDKINNTITIIGSEMNTHLSKMANDQEIEQEREARKAQIEMDMLSRVQSEIDALPDITFEEAYEAIDVIGACPKKSKMFFGYDEEKKVRMVKMVARKANR